MMWFLSFGLLILMTWSLQNFAKEFSDLFSKLRASILTLNQALPFAQRLLLVVTEPSLASNQQQALTAQGLRLRLWKSNLSWMALAPFSLWLAFVVPLIFLQVSALWLVSGACMGLLILNRWKPTKNILAALFFLGLALFAAENSLRFLSFGGREINDWTMFLADSRWWALLIWFALGALQGFLLGLEFFALSAALAFLAAGLMSIDGAVLFWLGERLGFSLKIAFQSRGLSRSAKILAKEQAWIRLGLSLVGILSLGFIRDFWGPVSMGLDEMHERMSFFWQESFLCEVLILLGLLIWSISRGKQTPEDLFERKYDNRVLFQPLRSRPWVLQSLLKGLLKRQIEIKDLRANFQKMNWEKVPPAVKQASEHEEKAVQELVQYGEALLLSSPPFFNGQPW